jgi:hypothetical protein
MLISVKLLMMVVFCWMTVMLVGVKPGHGGPV